MKKIVSLLLVIILAVGLVTPVIAVAATESACASDRIHIVQQGDTLWRIALDHDTTWEALAQYNGLDNPHLIFPGQEIRIPVRMRDLPAGEGYGETPPQADGYAHPQTYGDYAIEDYPRVDDGYVADSYPRGDDAYTADGLTNVDTTEGYPTDVNAETPAYPGGDYTATPFASYEITLGEDTLWPIGGTLTMPASASNENPVPAVVLVHGSGASDRNLAIGHTAAFHDIAAYLSANGIAVLRYDKRTYVHDVVAHYGPAFTVVQETIEDAILAAEMLRADPRIDSSRVYMAGLSLGGMLAPRIHAQGGDFAGLIIMAGSPRQLLEITADQESYLIELGQHQLANLEEHLKLQHDEITAHLAMLNEDDPLHAQLTEALYEITNALDADALEELYAEGQLYLELWQQELETLMQDFATITEMTPEEAKDALLGLFPAYYLREMALHPTTELLAETDVPMLILQGDNDFQVFAHRDFVLFKELLGDRENVTFHLYAGLGHLFMPSTAANLYDSLFERDYVPAQVYAEVLRDIVAWILAR